MQCHVERMNSSVLVISFGAATPIATGVIQFDTALMAMTNGTVPQVRTNNFSTVLASERKPVCKMCDLHTCAVACVDRIR